MAHERLKPPSACRSAWGKRESNPYRRIVLSEREKTEGLFGQRNDSLVGGTIHGSKTPNTAVGVRRTTVCVYNMILQIQVNWRTYPLREADAGQRTCVGDSDDYKEM